MKQKFYKWGTIILPGLSTFFIMQTWDLDVQLSWKNGGFQLMAWASMMLVSFVAPRYCLNDSKNFYDKLVKQSEENRKECQRLWTEYKVKYPQSWDYKPELPREGKDSNE